MSSEIHYLKLKFAFFLWFFFFTGMNIWRIQIFPVLVNFRNKAVYSIYLALMIFNFIPANSAKWGEILDVNIHKTNKVVFALKRKKAKARINAKKSNTRALPCLRETRSGTRTCFGPRNSKIVYQNSRLSTISTFNMTKVNRYDNRGKISRTS